MKKVLLGMSGGVDSSASAVILKEAGYEVIGATMKLCTNILNKAEGGCTGNSGVEDAKKVCEKLGIEHIVIDAEKEFEKHVVNNFICSYQNCQTPNPCVECNKYLKFGVFYNKAIELGCDYIATGHYAKIEYNETTNEYELKKSQSDKKDQTYFLYGIKKEILPKIIFPLESFTDKDEIRKIAEEKGLTIATKKDSQDICFIPDNDYINFLNSNISKKEIKEGNIVLKTGEILGKHTGLINYTIGQRKGLGVSYKEPLYVIKLDKEKNEVVVGTEKDLYSKELYASECNFLTQIEDNKEIEIMAKVRFRAKEAKATLKYNEESKIAYVRFEKEQRAITPGQSVVFYKNNVVIGGGKII